MDFETYSLKLKCVKLWENCSIF